MLLSYNELLKLQKYGVIENSLPEHVNGASIDVTLGMTAWKESGATGIRSVNLGRKETPDMVPVDVSATGLVLAPGEFALAQTQEVFNLPSDIACEFKLKSSGARSGLNNALATWCDPSWHGSVLTLELTNTLKYHNLIIPAGCKIGQMIFYRVEPVPHEKSYAIKGQYNNDTQAQPSRGIR